MPLPPLLVGHSLLAKLSWEEASSLRVWTLADSQAYCRRLTCTHYENFTVASWFLPRELRQPFADLYAYCRWADDLADEFGDASGSVELLDWWQGQLEACWHGQAEHPVFIALGESQRRFQLSKQPFLDLLAAFRRDQVQTRYATWDELRAYCRGSANPVGRLVLELARCRSDRLDHWSDAICTGLQIANFCQDVALDARRGRIYLPREVRDRYECVDEDFAGNIATDRLRGVVRECVQVASQSLEEGRPLLDEVPRWLRRDLRLFLEGGHAILQVIARRGYDVWSERPRVGRLTKLKLVARALLAT
ncbi:MAG: squalene synthase HpnC [Pirellulales bacterium]